MDKLLMDLDEAQPLDKLQIGELKKRNKTTQQDFLSRQKDIDESIKTLSNRKMLPLKTLERYDERFSKKNEKKAFVLLICIFIIAFMFTFAMQPSIFFQYSSDKVYLANLSGREVTHVGVYTITEALGLQKNGPKLEVAKLAPKEVVAVPSDFVGIFVATADRQLPVIGMLVETTDIGNLENGIYKGLSEERSSD